MYIALDRDMQVSVEHESDGVVEVELEYEFYGKLEDFDALVAAATTVERQEQYEIKKSSGTIRVRMSTVVDVVTYMLNSKTWDAGKAGKDEVEHEVSADMFAHFKKIADSGMIKTRYTIPAGNQRLTNGEVEPISWEYDVFEDREGKRSDWVKVDLEVKEALATIPDLPIALSSLISNQKNYRTPKEVALLTKLFKEEFLVGPGVNNVDQGDQADVNQGPEDQGDQGPEEPLETTAGVSTESFFGDMFKDIFSKFITKDKKTIDLDSIDLENIKNPKKLISALEETVRKLDLVPTDKVSTDAKHLSLFQVGNKPMRIPTIKSLGNEVKMMYSNLAVYIGALDKYSKLTQSESKRLTALYNLSEDAVVESIGVLRKGEMQILSTLKRPISTPNSTTISAESGKVTLTNLGPVISEVPYLNDSESLLGALSLVESLMDDSLTYKGIWSHDLEFSHYEDYPELWSKMEELPSFDEWTSMTFDQSVEAKYVDAVYALEMDLADNLLNYAIQSLKVLTEKTA